MVYLPGDLLVIIWSYAKRNNTAEVRSQKPVDAVDAEPLLAEVATHLAQVARSKIAIIYDFKTKVLYLAT
ncbi:MAG: hypothetical protein IGS49_14465 [Chlorogloeopsis fritschii C42_A2020_084]|uniref:hypothetical protein n=1 Tax=Chlorogloeopsis fritschii TaxID=1124 RepID=UPI0019D9FAD4|nr:hypothetical protein [Chlorogloeopsis fritschii]MBF2006629.1 hypothetical protein [Chlorogloeopsis fritschii C42_A2020_084]